jgi:microcystin-dependent protein
MEKYLIIIIIIIVIYQLCCNCIQTDVKETFTNSQSVTGIDDNNAINTLAALAKDLQSPAGVTIPGNLNLKNKVVLVADDNVLRLKTPDLSSNSSLNVKNLQVDGVSNLTPKGVITAWMYTNENIAENGKEIIPPPTWALCDGTKGTPDLRGRFILGAGVGGKGSDNPNAIALTERVFGTYGGVETVTLSDAQMPYHNHGYNDQGQSSASCSYSMGGRGCAVNGVGDTWRGTDHRGGNQPHENMPPFYVLAYIMKL